MNWLSLISWNSISEIQFEKPFMLILLAPLLGLLIILLLINFVKFVDDEEKKGRWSYRVGLFISRSIIFLLLVLALMAPYHLEISQTEGSPSMTLLIDNSTSMQLFGFNADEFVKKVQEHLPVKVDYIGYGLNSRIGDGIFRHLNEKNLFVVTDGNNEKGSMSFFDIVTLANRFNTSLYTLKLKEKKKDVSVSIDGASTTIVNTDYNFALRLHNAHDPVQVKVTVDEGVVYDQKTTKEGIPLTVNFNRIGEHKVIAEILDNDYFEVNNHFYKVVDVVDKPAVLYVSPKDSIIEDILRTKYKVEKVSSLPAYDELKKYFMVVSNDQLQSITYEEGKTLETYTDEGDGLVVIGGNRSFTAPSNIDLILPVKLGEAEEKLSDFNFLFLVDSSGIIKETLTDREITALEMMKLLSGRKESINIAVMDFSFGTNVIQPFTTVDNLGTVYATMKGYNDQTKLEGVVWVRPAVINVALKNAMDFIGDKKGNNNIIIVSYGQGFFQDWMENALEISNEIRNRGMRIHSILVPSFLDNRIGKDALSKLSSQGRGMYMQNPTDIKYLFEKALIIANTEHWITQGLTISAAVSGFNTVIPVASAISLVTTGTGAPILTINNYNKVAVISTDDGEKWAEQMYRGKNVYLISRVFDWAVGDLNRKKDTYVTVDDARVNTTSVVEYKGSGIPSTERCKFYAKEDHYECRYTPITIGFDVLLGKEFGVNYDDEFETIGYNEADLQMLAEQTKGSNLDADNINAIVSAAKESARLKVQKKVKLDWILVSAALILFLLEILVRRVTQRLQSRKI